MLINTSKNILIVGLGLMGGSYAMGFRKLGFKVTAITLEQESIDYAIDKGIIDAGYAYVEPSAIAEADLVVFGLYPHTFIEWIEKNQKYFKPGCLITDVTGVKSGVVYKIQDMLRDDIEFIAAHPMAGKEVYGVQNSDNAMFKEANYIVTPTEKNTQAAIDECIEIGKILGFNHISVLTPEKHDEMIGFVSQLTHCIAVTLMTSCDDMNLRDYTGDSFRDLTRIARINDEMWSELFLMNKDALLEQMDGFLEEFNKLRTALKEDDCETMRDMMRLSTQRRAYFDKK